jgi:hypothetical protein
LQAGRERICGGEAIGDEILLSDAESFAAKASEQGVDVTLQVYAGMWHVWQMFAPFLPEAEKAVGEIGKFVRERLVPVFDPVIVDIDIIATL